MGNSANMRLFSRRRHTFYLTELESLKGSVLAVVIKCCVHLCPPVLLASLACFYRQSPVCTSVRLGMWMYLLPKTLAVQSGGDGCQRVHCNMLASVETNTIVM